MARKSGRNVKRLALPLALAAGAVGLLGGMIVGIGVMQSVASAIPAAESETLKKGWIIAFVLAGLSGVIAAISAWVQGGKVGSRVASLGLAVTKLGRGSAEVRVRVTGDDEVGALGRSIQYLASDLQQLLQEQDKGGAIVTLDPQVRQLRDKVLPNGLDKVAGFEIDGSLAPGSRGGLDYFDLVKVGDSAVLYLISGEGTGALSVLACRMARDELDRALRKGASPPQALSHVNKVMHQNLPGGVCAKATLLQIAESGTNLYQAGARSPLLICTRGEVHELAAEGIALGLDAGPVFDKALQPQPMQLSAGMRLVLVNEAALRLQGLLELLQQHSPKHTAMFMNVVLGSLEQDAGSDGLREDAVLLTAKKA